MTSECRAPQHIAFDLSRRLEKQKLKKPFHQHSFVLHDWGIGPWNLFCYGSCSCAQAHASHQQCTNGFKLFSYPLRLEILQRLPITRDLSPSKRLRQSCVLVDVNHGKAVEIILNSEKISRQQNQEIDSFIRWRMVNFMKVDFQARVSKRMAIFKTGKLQSCMRNNNSPEEISVAS